MMNTNNSNNNINNNSKSNTSNIMIMLIKVGQLVLGICYLLSSAVALFHICIDKHMHICVCLCECAGF